MVGTIATELLMIRHAPTLTDGRLAGRRDVPADCSDVKSLTTLRAAVGRVDYRVTSPALRCVQTATALWPDQPAPETDERLWEQDFGEWEGLAYENLPDLGTLTLEALAAHRPPGGESFAELCFRSVPALQALAARGGRIAVVAHAGTLRAALTLAVGTPGAALRFQLAPLSLTRLRTHNGTDWSVGAVNWTTAGVIE